jgi:alpha-2-macroglobulin
MVRASAPRFLNFGDAFEFPIVVQNQTDNAMAVDVVLRASNARVSPLAGRRVNVPANDRVEVRIPVSTATAGTAHFQVAATSGRWSDAAEVSLPVWTPATTEAFAAYGEIDRGAISQPVKAPADVFTEFGGLEIEASSTQLQQLTDAFLYLQNYPYECSEQLASRILSVAALRDVLTAFKANGLPPPAEIEAAVTRDVRRLEGMQNEDGGFGFWQRGDESWPILSIHVAHALARARQKQLPVPVLLYDRAQKYLRDVESHIPSRYGVDVKRALIAYALYVRMQMGDRDTAKARKLLAESRLEGLSLETIGWLLSVLSGDEASRAQIEQLRSNLKNRVTETASTAHFVCSYDDDDHLILNSNRRADAVVLEALIGDQPDNDLIPKIARGMLADRTQGRWSSTQENVFVLLALDRYFKTYEKVTPDFIAKVWLGDAFAGEQVFRGRSTDRQRVNVPMRYLTDNSSTQNLILSKEGAGRLYYSLAMSYAPTNLSLNSADYGFSVERTYEAIDDRRDVQRDTEGAWHIRAGARVRVRLKR